MRRERPEGASGASWWRRPPDRAQATPATELEVLQRIAKDLNTIKTVVILTFWLSVIVGVVLAFANSGNG